MSSAPVRVESPFSIGPWSVDPRKNVIERDHHRVRVEPKAMRVLVHLASRAGEDVPKEEILRAVWGGPRRNGDVLTNAIWELRKALGDDSREPDFIQTVPRRGYRLVAPVDPRNGTRPRAVFAPVAKWLQAIVEERRRDGDFLEGERAALLRVLNAKFGPLPERVARWVRDLRTAEAIDACLDRVTAARSLSELGIEE